MCLEFFLFFYLFLFFYFIHCLLVFDEFLPLVLLPYRFVDDRALLLQDADATKQIVKLEVRAGHLALVVEAALLVVVLGSLVALEVAVVEHVDLNKVNHLIIHDFALANLESQVLVVLVVLRRLRIFANIVKNELGVMVHDVRAERDETQLLGAVHDVARVTLVDLGHKIHIQSLFLIVLHHGHGRLRLVGLAVALVHLQLVVKVDFHGLALRIARILIEMALLVTFRRYRPRFEVSLLLVQLLHVVRVRRLRQQHDLLVGVSRVARDELGRRLVAIHGTAPLPLRVVRVAGHHGVQLLPLNIRHAVHLLVELLGPLLLVLYDFLTCVTVHVRLRVADAQHLLIRLLIIILRHHVVTVAFVILRWLLIIMVE